MRIIKYFMKSIAVAFVAAMTITSCTQEEDSVAKAVLASVEYMTFAATDAPAQTITVYSDGDWTVDAPEWITVSPASGTGTVEGVTVSVADNIRDGKEDLPRRDTVQIHGNILRSYANIIVSQLGDKYRDASSVTVSQVAGVSDGNYIIVPDAQVVAVNANGMFISDGTTNVYVEGTADVTVGDNISFNGIKATDNGAVKVSDIDALVVKSNSEVTYPAATDLTSAIASYNGARGEFVSISGIVSVEGGAYVVTPVGAEGGKTLTVVAPAASMNFAALNGHNVDLTGYVLNCEDAAVSVVAASVKDNGVYKLVIFQDDFSWLHDLAVSAGAGDSMGNDKDDNAKNAYTAVSGFAELLAEHGYEDLFPSSKTVYLQQDYLKFSKNKNVNGIKLPAMDFQGQTEVSLSFDWGVHVGGGGPDAVELVAVVEGSGSFSNGTKESDIMTHPQEQGAPWDWKSETLMISGVDNSTRISIRPKAYTGAASSSSIYMRWYIDNIEVAPSDGGAVPPASSTVYADDFEWLEPYTTLSSAGDAVATNNPSTTAPNVFTAESISADFLKDFAARGYEYMYGMKGQDWSSDITTEGANPNVLYLQKNYLKFGKSSVNACLRLPALESLGDKTADITVTFDWCWQVTGSFNADIMTLTVVVEGSGVCTETSAKESLNIESAQSVESGASKLEWQHATVKISGASKDTRIVIRPTNYDPAVSNPDRKQNRWYLDNINITK